MPGRTLRKAIETDVVCEGFDHEESLFIQQMDGVSPASRSMYLLITHKGGAMSVGENYRYPVRLEVFITAGAEYMHALRVNTPICKAG